LGGKIMTIHMNKTVDQPLMNSMAIGGYKNTNVENPRGGYHKPFVVTVKIPDHRNGHFVRPNRVAFKYLDF